MTQTVTALKELYERIPRRHSSENMLEINSILSDYEDLLISIEGENSFYEKNIAAYFDELEEVKLSIKNSNSSKASKKMKDSLFDEGSGKLKDSIEALIEMYGDGERTE